MNGRNSKGQFVKGRESENTFWDLKELDKVIEKCVDYQDFYTNHENAYYYVKRNKLFNYVKSKLSTQVETNYTEDIIMETLSNCGITKMSELSKSEYYKVYAAGLRRGMKEQMDELFVKTGKTRTKEECHKEALKYETKKEFKEKNSTVYKYSFDHGWLDEICTHMKSLGSLTKRANYVYEFSDNSFYAGLTDNLDYRHEQHMDLSDKHRDTSVTKHMRKTGLYPVYKIINSYIDVEESQRVEDELIKEALLKNKNVLNVTKSGGLGAVPRVSDDELVNFASKYNSPGEWKANEPNTYNISINRNSKMKGYHKMICERAGLKKVDTTKWTFEKIKQFIVDNDCKTKSGKGGLKDLSQSAYNSARRNGWLNKLF
jgi:predicted GIY-YIG superfamily endonuclease